MHHQSYPPCRSSWSKEDRTLLLRIDILRAFNLARLILFVSRSVHSFVSRASPFASSTRRTHHRRRSQTPSPIVPKPVPTPRININKPNTILESSHPRHPRQHLTPRIVVEIEPNHKRGTYSPATQTYRSAHPRAFPPPRVAIAPNRPPRSVASVARRSSFDDDDDDDGRGRRGGVKTTPNESHQRANRKLNLESHAIRSVRSSGVYASYAAGRPSSISQVTTLHRSSVRSFVRRRARDTHVGRSVHSHILTLE